MNSKKILIGIILLSMLVSGCTVMEDDNNNVVTTTSPIETKLEITDNDITTAVAETSTEIVETSTETEETSGITEETSTETEETTVTPEITTTAETTVTTTETTTVTTTEATTKEVTTVTTTATTVETTVATTTEAVTEPEKQKIVNGIYIPTRSQLNIIEDELERLVNEHRIANGKKPVDVTRPTLKKMARMRAEESTGLSKSQPHTRANGKPWDDVFKEVMGNRRDPNGLDGDGIVSRTGGENQIMHTGVWGKDTNYRMNGGFYTFNAADGWTESELKLLAKFYFETFKKSPDHNKNMLNDYPRMSVGIYAHMGKAKNGDDQVEFEVIQLFA